MNEKIIWDYLIKCINNAYGVAAIMGNLMAESSLNPACATGKNKTTNYVQDVNNGKVDFENDGVAFGLVQWCYHSRKKGLINYAKLTNKSIDNLQMQLEYIVKELSESYKTVFSAICEAKDIRSVSDIIMLKYEKQANTNESAKQKRAAYGNKFYDMFISPSKQEEKEPKTAQKYVTVTTDRVNIRAGNSKNFPRVSWANTNDQFEWVATSENGWYAVKLKKQVGWVSGEFSKLKK